MTRMKKSVSYLLLCLTLCIAVSCSAKPGDGAATQAGRQPEGGSGAGQGEELDTPGGEGIVLKILGEFDANIDPANDPVKGEIEERTGYRLEYSMLPQDNANEKLSLEITSGVEYDILMLDPERFRMLAKQNALMDIGELVDEFGPTLKSVIPEETWALTTLEGGIYAVPQKNERANIENCIAMRKDMLDAVGMDIPTNLDEFHAALAAIKEAYPDVAPFTHLNDINIRTIRSAFGLYSDWLDEGGEIVSWVETERIKDYYQYMITLYNEGLIDRDLPVNKAANRDERFTSGRAASMVYGWFDSDKIGPTLKANFTEAELALVNPLEGDMGYAPGIQASVRFLKASAVPKNSSNAEHAVCFMDKKLEWDNFLYLTLGVEGETFVYQDEKYYPIMPAFNETRSTAYYYLNGIDEVNYAEMWLARVRRNEYVGDTFDLLNADFDKYATYDPVAMMPALDSVSKYNVAVSKLVEDYQIKLITGGEGLDNYEAFLEEWRLAGGAAMTEEINAWYRENR